MEIKRPSHICAGAVFEFAAIFWNLPEKFLLKAFFKHALALAFKGIAFCFGTYFCTASGYINSSCGTFTLFVIGTVVGFAVNLDGLTSTAVFGTVHGTLAFFRRMFLQNFLHCHPWRWFPLWNKAYLRCKHRLLRNILRLSCFLPPDFVCLILQTFAVVQQTVFYEDTKLL